MKEVKDVSNPINLKDDRALSYKIIHPLISLFGYWKLYLMGNDVCMELISNIRNNIVMLIIKLKVITLYILIKCVNQNVIYTYTKLDIIPKGILSS